MFRSGKNSGCNGKISIISLLAVIAICFVVAIIMFPIFFKTIEPTSDSTCQWNLNQLAKALKAYTYDWNDKFPTNRTLSGNLSCEIRLSPDSAANSRLHQYGHNWVEALYPYVKKVSAPDDNQSVWRCPNAKDIAGNSTAATSYAMNYNLLELAETDLKLASNTMLLREMDRTCKAAVCRPVNRCNTSKTPPVGAFFTESDPIYGKCSPKLHGSSSYILFADGHVGTVQISQMPEVFTVEKNWDKKTKRWWDSTNHHRMMITINP
ncbi:MAG: hypothetical protein ABFD64_06090 [Armatimonadota bacterium]